MRALFKMPTKSFRRRIIPNIWFPVALAATLMPFETLIAFEPDRPEWSRRGKVVWGGNLHEPLAFYRRENTVTAGVNANGEWLDRWYRNIRSPGTIRELARLGANVLYLNYAKGAGGDEEFEDLEGTREVIDICRENGIRTLAYIQFASCHAEELYLRHPEARAWRQVGPDGRTRTYHDRYYREIMCPADTGYVNYLKTLLGRAITDFGFDGIFLDNCYYDGCYCEDCLRSFRDYLRREIPDPFESLGISSLEGIRLPEVDSPENTVSDRLHQEWLRWRVNLVPDVLDSLRNHLRAIDPEAVFTGNTIYPRMNNWHLRGVNPYRIMRIFDMPYIEGHNYPRWENGIAVNNAPAMLMAVKAQSNAITGVWLPGTVLPESSAQIALALGESLAFGGHTLAAIWALRMKGRKYASNAGELAEAYFTRPEIGETWERYNRFLHENSALYAGSRLVSPVVVYHSEQSMAFDWATAYPAFVNTTQSLLQRNVPFDILFSQDIESLSHDRPDGRVLLVCSQRCLGASEIEIITGFVERGGTLILTGESGLYDSRRRERPDYGFSEITGASMFERQPRHMYSREYGKGRVFFFPGTPELEGSLIRGGVVERVVPDAIGEVVSMTERVVGETHPAMVIRAPEGVASALFRTADGRLALHLINYRNTLIAGEILIRTGDELAGRNASILSPGDSTTLRLRKADGTGFRLDGLLTYACIVWE